jgi:galactokinase
VLPHDSVGMLVAVTGNVPQSSGLSSSSALVSAAALVAAHSNKVRR